LDPNDLTSRISEKAKKAKAANHIKAQVERFASYWPSADHWSLADIAAAGQLALKYREILPLRSETLANPNARSILNSLIQKADTLRARKSELSENFHSSVFKLRTETENAAHALRNAGRLSILSGAYREAKAFYVKHAKGTAFVAEEASRNLQAIIAYLVDAEEFNDLARNTGVFGVGFLGVDTDFQAFIKLCAFYDAVESQFNQFDHREIRSFLKTADIDYIASLPNLPTGGLPGKASDVVSLGARLEAELAELQGALEKINPLVAHFVDPSGISLSRLPELVGQISDFQNLSSRLDSLDVGTALFGPEFCGWNTAIGNWKALLDASDIVNQPESFGENVRLAIENGNVKALANALSTAIAAIAAYQQKIAEVSEEASVDLAGQFESTTDTETLSALETAANDRSGLVRSIALASLYSKVDEKGVLATLEAVIAQTGKARKFGRTITALLYRSSAERVYDYFGGELRHYSGLRIEDLRSQMKDADEKVIELSRSLLRANLIDAAKPPQGVARGRVSEFTESALLDHLSDLKKISVPVRDIIRRSFQAIQELKPCWMMSPLAIAQYVPKDGHGFDLCIIDEASQMPPADAIGALYRCRQALVVGDSKQLPPTSFFRQFIDDTAAVDDDADPVTEESILEKTASAFKPSRTLRWHYRSKHSGLIRFSNKIMYQDDLVVFPSSDEDRPNMGVQLVQTGGLYKSNMNEIEAKVVIDAALRSMKDEPDRSLGIVAVNQKQADHIRQQLDFEIPRNSHASRYVEKWSKYREGLEEFFVKNLENVQGDERDVIFISTVYGPSSIGQKAMQRFGPINGEGGKRRLNVLFTRAKQNIRTFTSLTSADITATEHSNAGAWMLKRWLDYSAGMQFDVANDDAGGAFDSPFEEHVAEVIKGMGYTAIPQVGSAGFWIDIGVRHPDWPFGFLLGVECDGAAYHSSKSARDRDHYRQAILEELGWSIHRIWSTDWYQDPEQEKKRLQNAISNRLADLKKQSARRPDLGVGVSMTPNVNVRAEISATDTPVTKPVVAKSDFRQQNLPLQQELRIEPAAEVALAANSTSAPKAKRNTFVELGDTVRIRYLDKEGEIFQFKIVIDPSAPERGIVNRSAPLAKAVLENEEGDTLEILQGSRIRKAVLEMVKKR
jgi:transcription elongation GreA/GreB family factor